MTTASVDPSRAMRGVMLMTVAMLVIPLVDGLAKYLSAGYSPLFISWARYAVASAIVLPVAVARPGRPVFPTVNLFAHTLRTVFLVVAMTLYFLALARIPLATTSSAYFVGPILAAVLATVWLKEKLTTRKILSLALGFAGSLVILRPGGTIEPGLLMAFGAGLFFALYMIATRQASRDSDPLTTLAFQCLVGTVLLTPQAIWAWSTPAVGDLILLCRPRHFLGGRPLTVDRGVQACRRIDAGAAGLCRADRRSGDRLFRIPGSARPGDADWRRTDRDGRIRAHPARPALVTPANFAGQPSRTQVLSVFMTVTNVADVRTLASAVVRPGRYRDGHAHLRGCRLSKGYPCA